VRRFLRWFLVLLLLCVSGFSLRAEELLAKVQRELHARKFYFGEINGRATDETVTAIKDFQLAKGIDSSGQLGAETLRALGFREGAGEDTNREEARLLEECHNLILRYLQACQSGDWQQEAVFYTDVVNYYYDQNVSRDFIRDVRAKETRRWPHRKSTMLNRIVSLEPGHPDQAQLTARVRTEVRGDTGPAKALTEDLLFRLEKSAAGWRIAAVKLL
jgi:hypothetical protein